jgi:hypothetical protein
MDAEHGIFATKEQDHSTRGGAVGVGDVAAFSRIHDKAAELEIIDGILHVDLIDAMLIGELDAALHVVPVLFHSGVAVCA